MKDYDKEIRDYYDNNHVHEFYKKVWGGDHIHIGIYDKNTDTNTDSNCEIDISHKDVNIKDIQEATNRKSELIYKLIKKWYSILNKDRSYIRIADFGAGMGGTSRIIYKKFCSDYFNIKKLHIDCYDLSVKQCEENITNNIKIDIDAYIQVFNRSYCDIELPNETYDIIISEDSFLHIKDKPRLFKEIYRLLMPGGLLIFSDIILTEEHNPNSLEDIYKRVNINSMETHTSYRQLANEAGLYYYSCIDMRKNMEIHYKSIKEIVKNELTTENKLKEHILKGINSWIDGIVNKNITGNIFIMGK